MTKTVSTGYPACAEYDNNWHHLALQAIETGALTFASGTCR